VFGVRQRRTLQNILLWCSRRAIIGFGVVVWQRSTLEAILGLLQPGHLILLLVIALVIVGPSKITGLGGALGSSIRDFRKAVEGAEAPAEPVTPAVTAAPIAPLASSALTTQVASVVAEAEEAGVKAGDA
jgi:sec-independent protein translocase protein TatA